MEQKTKKCPYCGEEILAVAKKCKYCGEWLKEDQSKDAQKQMIPCPICSEMIEEGTEVCPHCHEHLTKQSVSIPVVSQPHKTENKDDNTRSFFDYYLWDPFFRHYADFKGRLNRKHYWISILVWILSLVALIIMYPIGTIVLAPLFLVASIIPLYAMAARRMRDGDSVPGLMGWISLFFPSILWWLVKPTEPRLEEIEEIPADTPQTVKFKKSDKIVCAAYVLLLVIGLVGWRVLSDDKIRNEASVSDEVEYYSDGDNAINENTQDNVKEAYLDFLSKLDAMDEDQIFGRYFLFDITGDGIPELWIESGTCEADHALSIYTYNEKLTILDAGEEGNASHSGFCRGDGYILQVCGHMGYQTWNKITYSNGTLKSEVVFEEDLNESGKDDYTEPSEPAIESYPFDDTEPVVTMFDHF